MAGVAGEESGASRSSEGISIGQRCQSGELAELRSSDQVENGTPSTSPPYWDTDDEDDGGPKPAELYGKYTWKIEKFSQINKRELRSNAFEVGGYKWYILIYPQGCDVCNHLSLFLCVANHEKLLPGWSHFAQFTIAVVNKDSKKSKYSDTLHRFWKKEHDWGWKKFMELSKVLEGFIESDNLIIKAQVQVIREKADRPFRCLDCNYRRELVRVYLTNVEQVCRRFVEERRSKLGKLIEDKARWSSFRVFWLGIDQNSRRRMSREKSDSILKVVVKHFFIEKEVTSTLVMDSLYSGLKALEGQTLSKKSKVKLLEAEEMPAPIVRVEKDSFVLVDDVLRLLERAASEPLPPKDEKGPQNRTKDGNSGDDSGKDTSERDERRLTELGRRTVEIFVLSHIFSNKIEVAYQEAVSLKRQEELIREEEAAWLAEIEQKAKRTEKKEKSKKKQAKQKRNNRKGKDKVRDERPDITVRDQEGDPSDETKESSIESQPVLEKPESVEDISDVSDSVDGTADVQPDSEDRDPSPMNWDTDTSEVQQSIEPDLVRNGLSDKKSQSLMDDSSSTCSTDSVPSVVTNGSYLGKSIPNIKNQKSPTRVKNRGKARSVGVSWENDVETQSSVGDTNEAPTGSSKTGDSEPEAVVNSLRDHLKWLEKPMVKKEEEVVITPPKKSNVKDPPPPSPVEAVERSPKENKTSSQQQVQRTTKTQTPLTVPTPVLTPKSPPATVQHTKPETHTSNIANVDSSQQVKKSTPLITHQVGQAQKAPAPAKVVPAVSRPSSAPLAPPPSGPRPNAQVVSMVQTSSPLLSRSMSAVGRLGPDPSPATHSFVPQSYRNAMMMGSCHHNPNHNHHPHIHPGAAAPPSTSAGNQTPVYFLPQSGQDSRVGDSFPFGKPLWDPSPSLAPSSSSLVNDIQSLDLYSRSTPVLAGSGPREHPSTSDEFPHLDIINDLLDDENGPGPTLLSRQFTFPGDLSSGVGPSGSSSCRFERTRSYHDEGFDARAYGSSGGGLYDLAGVREFVPQAGPVPPYSNGQLVPSQWQMAGPDMPVVMMGEAYPYYNLEYPNIACGVNGYTMFRPSNGL